MAKRVREEHYDCIRAFTEGNPVEAEQLLSCIPQSGVKFVTTTFKFSGTMIALVSLLHLAAYRGWKNVVTALVSVYNCDANCKDEEGHIPLHYAAYNGRLEVVKYFLKETNCIASCENNNGVTPLHFACSNGHRDIARYLIREENCDPSCDSSSGAPLHFACRSGHLNIVRYLIEEEKCDPSCTMRINGWTPLHFASMNKHADIVKYLLSTGRVDPRAVSKGGQTALDVLCYAGYDEISKLFQPIEECRNTFPLHKLILVGDSGAGKTTFAEKMLSSSETKSVTQSTAGIIPHRIQITSMLTKGKLYFVMYDFSGRQEYYSSHAAVLEHMMRKSRATFLCLVDLTKTKEEIDQSLNYWLSFINNACSSTAEGTSCLAIIGSHADQMLSSEAKEKLSKVLEVTGAKRLIRQQYIGYCIVNCRCLDSDSRSRFNDHLFK